MCGKFTQMATWRQVVAFSQLIPAPGDVVLTSTPMRMAHVIRATSDGPRDVVQMRWGFVDHRPGARDIPRHMHARCETIDTLPTFADAFAERRGILLVDTFNEGEEIPVSYSDGVDAGRTWTRQWTIWPKDRKPLAIAVIYEAATVLERPMQTFVQVTTPANAMISKITDRMPAILQPDDWPLWLGETRAPLADVKALLRPYEDGGAWTMDIEDPTKNPPRPRNPNPRQKQGDLF
jgi:putative SOS response-associated peptidase YedK